MPLHAGIQTVNLSAERVSHIATQSRHLSLLFYDILRKIYPITDLYLILEGFIVLVNVSVSYCDTSARMRNLI